MFVRTILILLISLFCFSLSSCDSNSQSNKDKKIWNGRHWVKDTRPDPAKEIEKFHEKERERMLKIAEQKYYLETLETLHNSQIVYICTGKDAYAYHYNAECSGLNNCSNEIHSISESEADIIGRIPCEICCR